MHPLDLHPSRLRTIDDVLADLDRVVGASLAEESRIGYFAALYREVTRRVKQGIEEGLFDDGERMERLDVLFARHYLDALDRFLRGERPTAPWQVALDATGRWRPLILQHLLAGINAHINLDLGIAAAEAAPGGTLPSLERDFDRVNGILFSLVDRVEEAIGSVSPWLAWLERIGGRTGDELIRFSLGVARDGAWRLAERLAGLPPERWVESVEPRSRSTARLGLEVLSPGPFLRWGLLVIRLRESNDVRRNIEVLAATPPPVRAQIEARVERMRGGPKGP